MQRFNLEAIKQALPVERVLELHGIATHRRRGRCPIPGICAAKTGAALSISMDGRAWRCHRCQAAGDVFRLVELLEVLQFSEAVRRCAALCGLVSLPRGIIAPPKLRDFEADRREAVGELFRTTAGSRDLLQLLASDTRQPLELRATALAGVVLCNRKLDAILEADRAFVDRMLEEEHKA